MAMCGTKDMEECGLTITDEVRQFKGLGRAEARKARPALLEVLGKALQVEFFVVDQKEFPMLIGVQELRALNVVVDPVTRCLRDRSVLGVYSVEERQYLEEKQMAAPDLAGHDVTSEDNKLMSEGRSFVQQATQHLPEDEVDDTLASPGIVLRVLAASEMWRVTALKAKFIVKGPPIKQKIRMLPEALRKELDSQLEAMLAAGVIRPSKSPLGSAPVFVKKKATGEWRYA